MKMKLNVSYDCGVSYQCDMEIDKEEDCGEMAAKAIHLDGEGLRWIIEDDKGEIVAVSHIHKKVMAIVKALRK